MRALVVSSLGPDFEGCAVQDIPRPEPGPGQVLVRVRAASLNFPDLLMTRGAYQFKPPLPFVPGLDFAGDIETLGEDVTGFGVGDAVFGATRVGAFAEYLAVDAAGLRAKPAGLDHAHAAACLTAYLTAYHALVVLARVQPGEWVLVHGATGGVGLAAVDLARALGARVIATSEFPAKLRLVERFYRPDAAIRIAGPFRDEVKAITGGGGADVVFDPVGGDQFDESVHCIGFGGRLLVVGFTSGRIATVATNMPLIKGFSVIGVRAGEHGRRFPAQGRASLDAVAALAGEGRIRPRVHCEVPLEDWREAFELMAGRRLVGKAVIRPDL